jgi:hypothetical protein
MSRGSLQGSISEVDDFWSVADAHWGEPVFPVDVPWVDAATYLVNLDRAALLALAASESGGGALPRGFRNGVERCAFWAAGFLSDVALELMSEEMDTCVVASQLRDKLYLRGAVAS